jgi:AcrR family transcriptional regulator
MREISRAAGQKNPSALQYHFASKEGLIKAILVRRMNAVDRRRLEYLDNLESHGQLDNIRSMVAALIIPLAEGLWPAKRPRIASHYLGFLSAVQRHPSYDLFELGKDASSFGLSRLYRLIGKQLPHLPDAVLRQRFVMAVSQVIHALAEFERINSRRRGSRQPFDVERSIENLIDMTTGALAATVSDEVARCVEENKRSKMPSVTMNALSAAP